MSPEDEEIHAVVFKIGEVQKAHAMCGAATKQAEVLEHFELVLGQEDFVGGATWDRLAREIARLKAQPDTCLVHEAGCLIEDEIAGIIQALLVGKDRERERWENKATNYLDDIARKEADLSMYRKENIRLQAEIQALRKENT